MTRAIHRRTGPTRAFSSLLIVVFALSVVGIGLTTVTLADDSDPSATGEAAAASGAATEATGAVEPEPEAVPSEEPPAEPSDEPADPAEEGASVEQAIAPETVVGEAEDEMAPASAELMAPASFTLPVVKPSEDETPIPGPPSGEGIQPVFVDGNPTCEDVCDLAEASLKLEADDLRTGLHAAGSGWIDVTRLDPAVAGPGPDTHMMDFEATGVVVYCVIMKGGPNADVYRYPEGWDGPGSPAGTDGDTSLHPPINPSNMDYYGISHITFCYKEIDEEPETYDISGLKWEDIDGNGLRWIGDTSTPSEPLLPGWTIQLFERPVGADWMLRETTMTGSDGYYHFKDLPPGEYKVEEVLQSGWIQTFGGCEFTLPLQTVSSSEGFTLFACHDEEPECLDFGNMREPTYDISGLKWEDIDGNGLRWIGDTSTPSEPLLPGWTIQLFENLTGGDWSLRETTVTGSDGYYHFKDLPAGHYKVEEVLQSGWIQTFGGCEFWLPEPPLTGGDGFSLFACHDEDPECLDFGNQRIVHKDFELTLQYPIPDTEDVSFYAVTTVAGEPATFTLSPQDATTFASESVTLPVGTEIGTVTWYADWDGDSGIMLGQSAGETLTQDKTNSYHYNAYVTGAKFDDTPQGPDGDPNGIWDTWEGGLAGWEITLYRQVGDSWVAYDTTTTAGGGFYTFYGVLPGTYCALETQQAGWTQSAGPNALGEDTFWVNPVENQGPSHSGPDFGNYQIFKGFKFTFQGDLASIPGTAPAFWVRFDADYPDGSGMADADDVMLPLMNGSNPFMADAFRIPVGTVLTDIEWLAKRGGEELLVDYDAGPETIEVDTLNEGTFKPAIFGFKWIDQNGDRQMNSQTETQAAGWTIELERWNGAGWVPWDAQATYAYSAANPGYFMFTNLLPGTYRLSEVEQAGYGIVSGPDGNIDVTWDDAWKGNHVFINAPDVTKDFKLELSAPATAGVTFYAVTTIDGEDATLTLDPTSVTTYESDTTTLTVGTVIGDVRWYADWMTETGILLGITPGETLLESALNYYFYDPSVSGIKYDDTPEEPFTTPDGVYVTGEALLPGWVITLYRQNAGGWIAYDTTTTAGDGSYWFSGMLPGTYCVLETPQAGWGQSGGPKVLGDDPFVIDPFGDEQMYYTGPDFGNFEVFKGFSFTFEGDMPDPPPSFWVSFEADFPDNGIGSVDQSSTIPLMYGSNPYTSDAVRLPVGTVLTNVEWKAQWMGEMMVLDSDPGPEVIEVDTLNEGDYDAWFDADKFEDVVHDSTWVEADGETGLQGWVIELYRMSTPQRDVPSLDDGQLFSTPAVFGTEWVLYDWAVTDANGHVSFSGLLPGTYFSRELTQTGWAQTAGPGAYGTDPSLITFSISKGASATAEFGNRQPVKTFDLRFTGDVPTADSFFARYHVTGQVPDIADEVFVSTVILEGDLEPYDAGDGKSHYRFVDDQLGAGDVIGWVEWYARYGAEEILLGTTGGETLGADDVTNEFEYGNRIHGIKWNDSGLPEGGGEEDGLYQVGEYLIPGWEIELYRLEGGDWVLFDTTQTDENGAYSFDNLLPGSYSVVEVIPDLGDLGEWVQSFGPESVGDVVFEVENESEYEQAFGNYATLPFTEPEPEPVPAEPLPYLPFTGGQLLSILWAALIAALAGAIIRRLGSVIHE